MSSKQTLNLNLRQKLEMINLTENSLNLYNDALVIIDKEECEKQHIEADSAVSVHNLGVKHDCVIEGNLTVKGSIKCLCNYDKPEEEKEEKEETKPEIIKEIVQVDKMGYYGEKKSNVVPLSYGMTLLKEIKPVSYNDEGSFGIVPAELKKSLKALGVTSDLIKDDKINMSSLVALLVKSTQQLGQKIEQLKFKVDEFEKEKSIEKVSTTKKTMWD